MYSLYTFVFVNFLITSGAAFSDYLAEQQSNMFRPLLGTYYIVRWVPFFKPEDEFFYCYYLGLFVAYMTGQVGTGRKQETCGLLLHVIPLQDAASVQVPHNVFFFTDNVPLQCVHFPSKVLHFV